MRTSVGSLVSGWITSWYMFNFLILPYDAFYILLRPTPSASAFISAIFYPLDFYSSFDFAFGNAQDTTVRALYLIGVLDLLLQAAILYMLINNNKSKKMLSLALLVVIQSTELATKTAVYLIYSWPFIEPSVRIPIMVMNSIWAVAPLVLAGDVVQRISAKYGDTTTAKDE